MYCTTTLAARCPGGTYSGDNPLSTAAGCTTCPAGHYCPIGSVSPIPCPPGTISSTTGKQYIYDCATPTGGTLATTWGNSAAAGSGCTQGHYCPVGASSPIACPAGTFTDLTNAAAVTDCSACTAGFACEEGTGGTVKEKLNCAAGHYCPAGTSNPYANPCPAGTYSANTDNSVSSNCTACTAGYYCEEGTTAVILECPTGHYCIAGTQTATQYPCPAGTYNHITKLTASSECFTCPAGQYCVAGSVTPTPCPVGTYTNSTGYEAAYDNSTVKGCEPCPDGIICDTPGTSLASATECGTGRYSYAGTTTCLTCEAGHYCPDTSTSGTNHDNTYICPAGYLCPAGMTVDPTTAGDTYRCPKGYYCTQGTTTATACLAGTYNPSLGGTSSSA